MSAALPYYPVYLADLMQSLSRLSRPDGVSAWQLLWHEYHYSRGLPDSDEKVRRIAGMTGNKKWDRVREELLSAGFTPGWCNPKWDDGIKKSEAVHAARVKGGLEKAARQRAKSDPPDYEAAIPF
jgi:uncharacterized protein YdaU (DUF1376 family)